MQFAHAAPLALSTPVPPTAATYVVLPAPLAGSLSIGAVQGWGGGSRWTLPSGAPAGVYRAPFGATNRITNVTLSNPADASGAFVVCAPGTPTPPPYPAGVYYADTGRTWPWGGDGVGRTEAAHLNTKAGSLGVAFAAGSIAIRSPLVGSLTLTGPGFSQTVPAGASGVTALAGPTGLTCTWVFSSSDDAGESNNVLVVGTLA